MVNRTPLAAAKACDAVYRVEGREMHCQRPRSRFPHVIHRWTRKMAEGGVMQIEWTEEEQAMSARMSN